MANTLLTSTMITREFARAFVSANRIAKNLDRRWESNFGAADSKFGKVGSTINIRKPSQFTVRDGWTLDVQNVIEESVPLTIENVIGIDLTFSSEELALSIDDFSKRYIEGPAQQLAADLDRRCASYMYLNTAHSVGTPGTAPNASSYFLDALRKIRESSAPDTEDIYCVIDPRAESAIVGALSTQYNPQSVIGDVFLRGQISDALGMKWFRSNNLPTHTCGSRTATTPVVNGANQTGASVVVSGAGNAVTYTAGDIVTFVGCYDVNPVTKAALGSLKQFVIRTTTTSSSGGAITLPIYPSIVTSGPTQNASASPTSSGAVGLLGTASTGYPQQMVFQKEAFAFASAKLPMPGGMDMAENVEVDGFRFGFVRGFDITNRTFVSRMDMMYGVAKVRPEWCCRIFA